MKLPELFSYSLSRPYPPHFTWIIVPGAVVLTALFSFVAVATNGYQFESSYQVDPYQVVRTKQWFQRPPFSWLADMDSTCEATPLAVGSSYVTSNRGFRYTVDGIYLQLGATNDTLATAPYRNGTLRDCKVLQITTEVVRRDNSQLAENYWAWGSTYAHALTTCETSSDVGDLMVNFTTQLLPVSSVNEIRDNYFKQNTSGPAGLFYGVGILASWYGQISTAMGWSVPGNLLDPGTDSWGAGWVTLTRNNGINDIKDPRFFECFATISQDNGGLSFMLPPATIQDWANQWTTTNGNLHFGLPNISIAIDAFSKTYYSLLLADFGSNDSTNLLLSADGIQYLQSINNTFLADAQLAVLDPSDKQYSTKAEAASITGLIGQSFDPTKSSGEKFNTTTPVTVSARYLCSTPRRKGGFSLFFSVLLADVVFLGACWTIFGFVATRWLTKNDPRVQFCTGCAREFSQSQIELASRGPTTSAPSISGQYQALHGINSSLDDDEQLLIRDGNHLTPRSMV